MTSPGVNSGWFCFLIEAVPNKSAHNQQEEKQEESWRALNIMRHMLKGRIYE